MTRFSNGWLFLLMGKRFITDSFRGTVFTSPVKPMVLLGKMPLLEFEKAAQMAHADGSVWVALPAVAMA